ncbi:MAG: hypothetical protein U9Q75_09775 [Pseudomonadota bacterium]|nr:hypothetical protein [Pseudomonadota bacterium]
MPSPSINDVVAKDDYPMLKKPLETPTNRRDLLTVKFHREA